MSIASEVSRIAAAKTAIATAVAGKGVTVPSGTLLDGMAALIDGIETGGGGGGLPTGITEIIFGSFTPASNVYSQSITHNFGVAPVGAMLWSESFNLAQNAATAAIHHMAFINKPYYFKDGSGNSLNTSSTTVCGYTFSNAYGNRTSIINTANPTSTTYVYPTTTNLTFSSHSAAIEFKAGYVYKYIIWR